MNTIEYAEIVPEPDDGNQQTSLEPKSFLEQLLSPIMLQRMMACGGAILVLGLVGWLWSVGIFEQPIVAASAIGLANLGVLGIGILLVRRSRYQLAGNGITLLAALALPLNLWFYDAQGLITLSNGGHLWIPAACCCVIYAFIARTLRNPMFVYTLVSGVVLAGLLFLADQTVNCFWRLLPPVSFLLATGWLSFFAEQLFSDNGSDFSRTKFGFAFRLSGIVVILGGLALLAGGQLAVHFSQSFWLSQVPLIATDSAQKLWAIGLLLGSSVGFTVDRLFRKQSRWSTVAAVGLFAWAGLSLLDLWAIRIQLPHFAIVGGVYLATTWWFTLDKQDSDAKSNGRQIGLTLLFVVLACLGALQYAAQFLVPSGHLMFSNNAILVSLQMFVTAAVGYVGWQKGAKGVSISPHLTTGALFAVLGVFTLAFDWTSTSLDLVAACGFVVPISLAVIAAVYSKPENAFAWRNAAIGALCFCLICLTIMALEMTVMHVHGSLCWMSSVTALTLLVASYGTTSKRIPRCAYLVAVFSVSQLVCVAGVPIDYSLVASTSLGGLLLILASLVLATRQSEQGRVTPDHDTSDFQDSGNLLVLLGTILGVLLSFNRLLADEATMALLATLAFQLGIIVAAGLISKSRQWRGTFRAAGIVNVLASILVINSAITTHWLQRWELGAILMGVAFLVVGHIGWYREGDTRDAAASAALGWGSFLVVVPLSCGLLFYRSHEVNSIWNWWFFHEAASITCAMVLLGFGMACRIRSTTIGGVALLTVYLTSLLFLVQWPHQLQNVSVLMMAGGGVFFTTAVLLSIYRDRILAVPSDIREGRGVFRVLQWR